MTSTREPSPSLWPLSRSECLDLLATTTVGRVSLMVDQRPQIFPVNYVLDGDTVLFRTAEGTILSHAGLSSVAFEVDRIDESHHTGWSVLVHGRADNITDAVDLGARSPGPMVRHPSPGHHGPAAAGPLSRALTSTARLAGAQPAGLRTRLPPTAGPFPVWPRDATRSS
jgi:uncharacterized protein